MKHFLLITIVLFSNSLFASIKIDDQTAVLIARAYITGTDYPVDGSVEDEIWTPNEVNESGYVFLVQDSSGDCAMTVVVKFDGSVDKEKTQNSCN